MENKQEPSASSVRAPESPPQRYAHSWDGVFFPGLAALVLAGIWWLSASIGGTQAPESEPPTDPPSVLVERASFEPSYGLQRSFVGRVEPRRVSRVGGEIGGLLLEVYVDEGGQVSEGQEIARFDASRLAARRSTLEAERLRQEAVLSELQAGPRVEDIAAQEAEVRRLRVAAELARSTADRVLAALEARATSEQEWDVARLSAEQAEAALAAGQASLDELKVGTRPERLAAQEAAVEALRAQTASVDLDIEKAIVRAPFDAQVSARYADEGIVLPAGSPIVELREISTDGRASGLEIRVGVLPEFASTLLPGNTLTIRYRDREAEATVLALRRDRSLDTRTVPVRLEPKGPLETPLLDGELVEVLFEQTVETPGAWIPMEALSEGVRGLWRCFVAVPLEQTGLATHQIAPRTIEVLHFESDRAFTRGALRDGELFVRAGTHKLVPGLLVRLAEEGTR